MANYTPPAYNQVNFFFDFPAVMTMNYVAPPYNHVDFDFEAVMSVSQEEKARPQFFIPE